MSMKKRKIAVLCFGGGDWWYHNRGHFDMQLMRRFAKKGTTLYVNSIVIQKPQLSQGKRFIHKFCRKARSILTGLRKSDWGFWVYSPLSIPLHHIPWARNVNEKLIRLQVRWVMRRLGMYSPLVWVVCPGACDVAIDITRSKLVWQRTDRWEEFPNVDFETVRTYDRKLKANADLTVYVNRSLFDEEAGQCRRAIYLDHGVDLDLFASAEQDPYRPTDIAHIEKPVVGYFGALDDHKLDVRLIEAVTDSLPRLSFVFVGKASQGYSDLAAKKNVYFLGQKPYEQIPHYGKCFDVAIIPWLKSRWTEAANPIKLKEYLALGKPLVVTPAFTELRKYLDVVYVANTPEEFVQCILKALAENSPGRAATRRKKVEKASWDGKAHLVLGELFQEEQAARE